MYVITIITLERGGEVDLESIQEPSEVPESDVDAGAAEFDSFPTDAWTNFLNAKETQLML